jgi:hypothetical protein
MFDNCPLTYNPAQVNTDGNFYDQSPPYGVDDVTLVDSDPQGDACDADDDNDGRSDALELDGPNTCASATGTTNPLLEDSDGDRFLDEVECILGKNPNSAANLPTTSECIAAISTTSTADSDGDRLKNWMEYCLYGTSVVIADTDADRTATGAYDGCEVASINGDLVVNSGDQLVLGWEISRLAGGGVPIPNIDLNRDGGINSGDQLFAQFLNPPAECP